ncbi:ADP-forming succinate--CoA ligase subunit beta [Bifidobacterium gallicum]|uniref:Succinate--CoA ligase [ADP-forming] subunit beta n=1 Tax=Bifidobacterium gallicum DSM 20093 = LMG 11596 TaxID=561180 RepID=D1NTL5_9BIFI|nr:ADP-forming succinate--CoA ligase subunit beta [Bifidobacterium gallicum]EFA23069.1 succinate-CoA ligase, beta subunit [Bifidobacterium gallicum DSM 20093 = LMG 11596]KFI58755.1 succinate--CoA ligase [Bifidobacterium gallicum DSM 20093 = LMG 11596]
MDLYEYQARELLQEAGIPTPEAIYARNVEEVVEALPSMGLPAVIKGQAKIGHRGQAGAVRLVRTVEEAKAAAEHILPMSIQGHEINGVLVAQAKDIRNEYYVSISVDRSTRSFCVLATSQGGTEVEQIAQEQPDAVKRLHISKLEDFDQAAALDMAAQIGFEDADVAQAGDILYRMWQCFTTNDATLVEINPLANVADEDGNLTLCALDAKVSLDGNAAFRHDGWQRFTDTRVADTLEARAQAAGMHYVHLDGQVGVIGNGAGLVMSSIDAVTFAGRAQGNGISAANFLDIGGGASAEAMCRSLETVLADPKVESVFINVYGGITSCEQVALGILQAIEELGVSKPLVVRFDGNAASEGLRILRESKLDTVHVAETMEQAATQAVSLAASVLHNTEETK